ncbi:hypothetical protein Gasu2_36020 [Galdieria sulphuraria]|uniref:BAR domain-containing protein n=1 Tax=Galdieria sulphuraria TaxID=130081 RepID=M2VVC6_GALSU|nr:uncharacterized protein Gasu_52730 [Galdieria sulphuraria]EME27171.1 hypothetical protein Gasu_52730 [Galdieria sulphuraria]GJD09345.1 hypothetical protein Gasu2_36020 [Galdieria sulphuraria]|eukprot:XP_005703691.1 hypothetical protein Gasu_52730 [Galdieria sulphuraria]
MTTLWSSAVSVVPSVSSVSSYIYDDDEELRTILLSCKKYRDTMDMVVRAAKAYRRSLGELAVAGKAAGEVYTCVADFTKSTFEEERRRSQAHSMFGTRRDTSSVVFEDQEGNTKFLYPENIRNLLTVLGEAEKNAHDGTSLFMERVSNPIIREGRRFHEKYMELHRLKEHYKNCKMRYLEAQKSLNKELSKPKTSMEAQVKGWAKVDELRREYSNISSHLLRFATQLEQEHHQALLEHAGAFILHHYGTLSASLDAVKPSLKLVREQWLSGAVEFLGESDVLDARSFQVAVTPPSSVSPSSGNIRSLEERVAHLETENDNLRDECKNWKETAQNNELEISAKESIIEKLRQENEKLRSIIFSSNASSSRKTSDLSFLSNSRERSLHGGDSKEESKRDNKDSSNCESSKQNSKQVGTRQSYGSVPGSLKESPAALISQYQAYKASRKSSRNVHLPASSTGKDVKDSSKHVSETSGLSEKNARFCDPGIITSHGVFVDK